jgi:hypothetical protein
MRKTGILTILTHFSWIFRGKPVKVLLGDITLGISSSNFSRLLVDVAETIIHPGYKPPLTYHDLALVRLKEKVKFSRYSLGLALAN